MFLFGLAVGILAHVSLPDAAPRDAEAFIEKDLKLNHYRFATVDLNGDNSSEVIVYADEPRFCGSGGCVLYVLTPDAGSYRIVTRLTVTRPPVRVLATSAHGWEDLGVQVSGGGIIRPYEARLRFDGRSYPRNPTVFPATRSGRVDGRIVLK